MNNTTNTTHTDSMVDNYILIVISYSLLLVAFGTIGNLISVFICIGKRLRKTPTFVFLAIKALVDILPLYLWNLNPILYWVYGYNMGDISLWSCRIATFLYSFSMESSIFILVIILHVDFTFQISCHHLFMYSFQIAVVVELCLSVKIHNWRKNCFKFKHALIASLMIIIFFFLSNSYLLVVLPFQLTNNQTRYKTCLKSAVFQYWSLVSFTSKAFASKRIEQMSLSSYSDKNKNNNCPFFHEQKGREELISFLILLSNRLGQVQRILHRVGRSTQEIIAQPEQVPYVQ